MTLLNLKKRIFQELEELFAMAAADEAAGEMDDYRKKLERIAKIAEILGMKLEIKDVVLDLKE
ncbi:MAG: hypothetical protein LBE35_04640 [Clostridiales bacterium]|jgi:hypothetical protein|nr:hypothetical protein [Clostridiales bacterium]